MQISSLSALSGASTLFGSSAGRQNQSQAAGQIMPNPATPAPSNKIFSLPRANLTAAAASQAGAVSSQLSFEKATAVYQSVMNAKGLYGYQSTLGGPSLMA